MNQVLGTPGKWMVKTKLSSYRYLCSLETVKFHPEKDELKLKFIFMSDAGTGGPKISLMKFLKGDKWYIPGNRFNYTFEGKDQDTGKRKALEALLVKKKRRIQKSIKNLTTKETLTLKSKKVTFNMQLRQKQIKMSLDDKST